MKKLLTIVFIIGLSQIGFAQNPMDTTIDKLVDVDMDAIFLNDCTSKKIKRIRQSSNQALLDYIKEHLGYPKTASEGKIEGLVLVRFVIEVDGTISNSQI